MMDKSAVQQIQQFGSIPEIIAQTHGLHSNVAITPRDFDIQNLEQYQEFRDQFRGELKTSHIREFVRYHSQHLTTGSQCFINAEQMTAKTVFDLGTKDEPKHGYNKAFLVLDKTSALRALLDVDGLKQGQKKLAEFIEDYAEYLQVFTSDGDVVEVPTASAAIRNMTFEAKAGRESRVDDFSSQQSEYESMAVRTKEEFPMPAVFKFTCVPYLGLPERTFELRMSTIGNETLILRIKMLELHQEEMAEEFQLALAHEFKKQAVDIETFIGSFSM